MFNICAVTAAKISHSSDQSIEEASQGLADNYARSYSDIALGRDIAMAARQAIDFIQSVLPNSSISANMTQLQYSIVNFEPDGTKRKKKLLGGTWFNKEKSQLPDKVDRCRLELTTYHNLIVAGVLPLAPQGWSIGSFRL